MADDIEFETAPKGGPRGTAFDALDSVWGPDYNSNNDVFDYGQWEAKDMAEMLDRDGKAKTIEQVLTLPIRHATPTFEPAKGDSGEAEFIERVLTTPANAGGMSTPLNQVIGQATSGFLYRKAFFEKVFREGTGDDEGKIVFDGIEWRPPSTCQLARDSRNGRFRGYRQVPYNIGLQGQSWQDWVRINPDRAWVYIHGAHRAPLRGYSDLEIALWAYRTKQKLRFLWYIFLEGQAVPKSIVRNKDFAKAKADALRVRTLKGGAVLALQEDSALEPYESSGKGADQFIEAIKFLDSEMSGSVLAGFTDLTTSANSGTGSYALSKNQSDFFLQSRMAVADELASSFNSFVVSDLVKYNFGQKAAVPEFKFGQIQDADIADALTLLGQMAVATSNNLPDEFVYMLSEKASDYLDLDTDKLRKAVEEHAKEKAEQAKQMADQMNNPAMAVGVQNGKVNPNAQLAQAKAKAAQVGKVTGATNVVTQAVARRHAGSKLSEFQSDKTIIDLGSADPKGPEVDGEAILLSTPDGTLIDIEDGRTVELAAVDGHHVPGTAYNWRHEWHAMNVQTAIKYRKGKKAIEALHKKGKHSGIEPEWFQNLEPGAKFTKKVGVDKPGTKETKVKFHGAEDLHPGMVVGDKKWKIDKISENGKYKVLHVTSPDGAKSKISVHEKSKVPVHHTVTSLHISSSPNVQGKGSEGGASLPFEGKAEKSVPAKKKLAEWEKTYKPNKPQLSEHPKPLPPLVEKAKAPKGEMQGEWAFDSVEHNSNVHILAKSMKNKDTPYSKGFTKAYTAKYPNGDPNKSEPAAPNGLLAMKRNAAQALANEIGTPQHISQHKTNGNLYVGPTKVIDNDKFKHVATVHPEVKPKESDVSTHATSGDAMNAAKALAKSKGADTYASKGSVGGYMVSSNKDDHNAHNMVTVHSNGQYTDQSGNKHTPLSGAAHAEQELPKTLGPEHGFKSYKTPKGAVNGANLWAGKTHGNTYVTKKPVPSYIGAGKPTYEVHTAKPDGDHIMVYPNGDMNHVSTKKPETNTSESWSKPKSEPKKISTDTTGSGPFTSQSEATEYAKELAKKNNHSVFLYKDDDGKWHVTTDSGAAKNGTVAYAIKPWGDVQNYDPDYDANVAQANLPAGHAVEAAPEAPDVEIKGQHKFGAYANGVEVKDDYGKKVTLTQDEVRAVNSYTGTGYGPMNDWLRKGSGATNAKMKTNVKSLDKLLSKYTLSSDTQVYRGTWVPPEIQGGGADLVGKTFQDKGFVSTSFSQGTAQGFGGATNKSIMTISVPKGSHAIAVTGTGAGSHNSEKEMILPRGTKFEVTGVEMKGGQQWITVVAHTPKMQ